MRTILYWLLSPLQRLFKRFFDPRFQRLEHKLDRLAVQMPLPEAHAPSTAAATFEVLTFMGDRIRDMGDDLARQYESSEHVAHRLEALLDRLTEQANRPSSSDRLLDSASGAVPRSLSDLSAYHADLLNFDQTSLGYSGQAGLWMNYPLWLRYLPGRVDVAHVNERIIELPFVFRELATVAVGSRVLDIGCSESVVALALASLGYLTTGIDMRPYPLTHPNLTVVNERFETWDAPRESFDAAVCLSAVEHFGVAGAYGACVPEEPELDVATMKKLKTLMKPGGLLAFTAPFGDRFEIDQLQRTYDERALARLMEGWLVEQMSFAIQDSPVHWRYLTRWSQAGEGVRRKGVVLLTARAPQD